MTTRREELGLISRSKVIRLWDEQRTGLPSAYDRAIEYAAALGALEALEKVATKFHAAAGVRHLALNDAIEEARERWETAAGEIVKAGQ